MDNREVKELMASIAPVLKQYVHETMSPVVARLDALESRGLPRDGKDGATVDDLRPLIIQSVNDVVARIDPPKDGEPGPQGEPGKDGEPGRDGVDGKDGVDGADGKDADVEEIAARLLPEIERAVAAIPIPKDGKDGRDGVDGRDGKDGLDAVQFIRAEDGALLVTMSDGTIRELGHIDGKDGEPGAPGKDGLDGVGFDDMTEELDEDGRTIIRRYERGEQVKEFRHTFAVPLYRGVYREGQTYHPGDQVTWAGSQWHCNEQTTDKPGEGKTAWTLSVKRGRDGKEIVREVKPPAPVKSELPKKPNGG